MSIYKEYTNLVSSNSNILNFFKRSPIYNGILEHVNYAQGQEYYDCIKKSELWTTNKLNVENISQITQENDKIGNPHVFSFDFGFCSPTSLRYIYHAILICEDMIKNKKTNINIVEVGGGYGGLCLILERISKIYELNIKKYYIIDLEEIIDLQKKYLDNFKLDFEVSFHGSKNFGSDILDTDLFLVSNYCLGEIGEELVKKYSEALFKKVNYGFLTWNNEIIWNSITDYFEIDVEQEKPLTFWFNKYIRIKGETKKRL